MSQKALVSTRLRGCDLRLDMTHEMVDDDIGALAEKLKGNSPADAGGAAGDDGSLALEEVCGRHCRRQDG